MTVRITRDEANVVYANVDKANDLVDKPTFAFTFKSVELHRHPDTGVVTTAPVVVPVEGDAPKARPARRDLPDKEELAMRALADLLADEGVAVPPAWNLPTSIKMMVPVFRYTQG
jgi:hypothetical protein